MMLSIALGDQVWIGHECVASRPWEEIHDDEGIGDDGYI